MLLHLMKSLSIVDWRLLDFLGRVIKVGVGSLFLVSSGKISHNNLSAFCNAGG